VLKILKICVLGIWNVWFYVLCFIGIVISMPFLIIFSFKESWYPYFFWVAKNIWSNTVMYGMGFYPSIKWKEKFKKGKSYMLVSNHKSMIDIMLMLSACDHPVVFVGKKELDRIPIFGYFYSKVCILVDRDSAQSRKDVYAKSARRLRNGLSICIFPEGGITSTELTKAKPGAIFIASKANTKILPVSISGGDNAWDDLLSGVRSRITVNIGKPFGPFDIKGTKEEKISKLGDYSQELMCRIAALLPDDRHGEYSNDKRIAKYRNENKLDLF